MSFRNALFILLLAGGIGVWPGLALSDPPAHAPAHGWRMKHDPYYVGYTGKQWPNDYGIISGRCNREAIGTVLGGMAGAAIGASVENGEDRAVAMIIGAAAGALIGNRIGRELDEADRACIGHALEIAEVGRQLTWTNESAGVTYRMNVLADLRQQGAPCREFTLHANSDNRDASRKSIACRSQDGTWRLTGQVARGT